MSVDLKTYEVYVKITVLGENEEDAVEYLDHAIDVSDLVSQDGIRSVEITDDIECVEDNFEEDDYDNFEEYRDEEDY